MVTMIGFCSTAVAVWALEVASIITSWSLELSFAAALAGARGDSEPKGLDIVLQVHILLVLSVLLVGLEQSRQELGGLFCACTGKDTACNASLMPSSGEQC